jgi:hypothetical protein
MKTHHNKQIAPFERSAVNCSNNDLSEELFQLLVQLNDGF